MRLVLRGACLPELDPRLGHAGCPELPLPLRPSPPCSHAACLTPPTARLCSPVSWSVLLSVPGGEVRPPASYRDQQPAPSGPAGHACAMHETLSGWEGDCWEPGAPFALRGAKWVGRGLLGAPIVEWDHHPVLTPGFPSAIWDRRIRAGLRPCGPARKGPGLETTETRSRISGVHSLNQGVGRATPSEGSRRNLVMGSILPHRFPCGSPDGTSEWDCIWN